MASTAFGGRGGEVEPLLVRQDDNRDAEPMIVEGLPLSRIGL